MIAPVFFLLIFGLMDGSWSLYHDHVGRGAASAGVRSAAALAKDPDADYQSIQTVKRNLSSIGAGKLVRVVIYKANGFGDPPTSGCQGGTPAIGVCNVYTPADLNLTATQFGCTNSTEPDWEWCPTSRNTAVRGVGSPPDYVGVWIRLDVPPLTRFVFKNTRVATFYSVLRVEPRT